ncbi:MAG: plastocyanin/azurin family copper-binding protein [Rhodospirillaceae bacterium]|nr:plastocyanin/azurin family copper-binding protein [Rhodospirillaceae bacterium]
MFLKSRIATGLAVLTLGWAGHALAAETVINQAGKKFDQKKVTINAGDSIKFVNNDKVAHNVHSTSKGAKFDLGAQKPGSSSSYKFAKAGKYKVRCAIHPKMKLKVTVK